MYQWSPRPNPSISTSGGWKPLRLRRHSGRLSTYYAPKDGRSVEHREPALVVDGDAEATRPARTEAEARRLLRLRLREVAVHKTGLRPFQGPRQERVTFEDLLQSLERDYEIRGLKSLRQLKSHLVHVRGYFGDDRALAVTTERLRDFVADRQKEGAKPASVKRQLEAIRRAFALATESGDCDLCARHSVSDGSERPAGLPLPGRLRGPDRQHHRRRRAGLH
jgi:hypothetical protein